MFDFTPSYTIPVTNPEWLLADVLADAWAPPPPVDYLEWAEKNIVFSEQESSFHGPYRRDLFPYFDEILRVLDSIQLTENYLVATPANWKEGEDCIALNYFGE